MYVVPVEVNLNSTAYMDETEEDNDDMNEVTAYDDSKAFSSPGTAATAPQQTLPSSARKSAATAAVSAAPPREPDWPQTDFIKQHILDAKLRSTAKGSSSSPAGRTLSRHASFTPSSNKSRSTTPTSMRQSASFRRDDSVTASLSGIDIYDIEEKTAALEAIQALRAQRKGPSSASPKHSREMLNNQDRNNQQNNSFSNGQYNSYSSNSLTELAAESNVSFSDTPTATRGAGGNSEYSRPTLSPQRSAESFPQQSGGSNEQNATSSSGGGSASATTTAAAQLNPNSDFAVFVQQTVDLAVQQRLSNDPELQKVCCTLWSCVNHVHT